MVKYPDRIPGEGMYVVGLDVAPGQYLCRTPGDGHWVRYPASGDGPVVIRHRGAGTVAVVIEPGDAAFGSQMPAEWVRVTAAALVPEDPLDLNVAHGPAVQDAANGPAEQDTAYGPAPEKSRSTGKKAGRVRTIFDPDMPPDVRKGLEAAPALVWHVRTGSPWRSPDRRDGKHTHPVVPMILIYFVFSLMFGMSMILFVMVLVITIVAGANHRRRNSVHRLAALARANPGWFLVEKDFDDQTRRLMARTQRAIRRIQAATVYQRGLVDVADHELILPVEEWEIAKALNKVTVLRAEQAAMTGDGVADPVAAALAPYRATLDTVVSSVTGRIEALERYAAKILEADRLYKAHDQLRLLSERTGEYRDLLAGTVRDDLARAEIERLGRNLEQLKLALEESLVAARLAALEVKPEHI
ncbi:hypothetical protein [Acrocarpospora catenulata]|uniref:hypothetical protein n=1 Tax=Acrocarpospora catenulata TaxID=2836182 RepID=UPI001BD9EB53|nr:hypothetical protein [Acrocarpospora catenulata]